MSVSKALRTRRAGFEEAAKPNGLSGESLASFSTTVPRLVVIGTSTGGPQALTTLLGPLSPHLDSVPVLVVIHMPPAFIPVVAQQLERATGRPSAAAQHGERPKPGQIYLAPGDQHLRVVKIADALSLCHLDAPPENFCRPSVDVLFRSAALSCGAGVLGMVLTGMGVDGRDGARAVVENGGSVIVQDEGSSVVWGMPGAVAREGLAAAILPPEGLAVAVADLLRGLPPRIRR
jgi:two-component system, chemotaxis family, protein-glutamate methylesterase/glutaminase